MKKNILMVLIVSAIGFMMMSCALHEAKTVNDTASSTETKKDEGVSTSVGAEERENQEKELSKNPPVVKIQENLDKGKESAKEISIQEEAVHEKGEEIVNDEASENINKKTSSSIPEEGSFESTAEEKNGKSEEIVDSLNSALQEYRNLLMTFLPPPLENWKQRNIVSPVSASNLFGEGIVVANAYRKNGDATRSLHAKIIKDNNLLRGMILMLTTPEFAEEYGGELINIRGFDAIIKYDEKAKKGSINVPVDKRFLVSLEGENVDKQILENFADSIDYDGLAAIP